MLSSRTLALLAEQDRRERPAPRPVPPVVAPSAPIAPRGRGPRLARLRRRAGHVLVTLGRRLAVS